jgi:hypothetical protein
MRASLTTDRPGAAWAFNVGMTLNSYSHVTPTLMSGTAAMMDRLLD